MDEEGWLNEGELADFLESWNIGYKSLEFFTFNGRAFKMLQNKGKSCWGFVAENVFAPSASSFDPMCLVQVHLHLILYFMGEMLISYVFFGLWERCHGRKNLGSKKCKPTFCYLPLIILVELWYFLRIRLVQCGLVLHNLVHCASGSSRKSQSCQYWILHSINFWSFK